MRGTLLQFQFDSYGISGTYAARFRGFLPLIRHLYLGGRTAEVPHNLVVGGWWVPLKMTEKLSVIGRFLQHKYVKMSQGKRWCTNRAHRIGSPRAEVHPITGRTPVWSTLVWGQHACLFRMALRRVWTDEPAPAGAESVWEKCKKSTKGD